MSNSTQLQFATATQSAVLVSDESPLLGEIFLQKASFLCFFCHIPNYDFLFLGISLPKFIGIKVYTSHIRIYIMHSPRVPYRLTFSLNITK